MSASWISEANGWFWARVGRATAVPSRSLATFRWVLGLYLLLFDTPTYSWIDDAPRAFFNPPPLSLSILAPGFPAPPTFKVVDLVVIVALVAMTLGWRTRTATCVVIVARLIGATFSYSFGKIDHEIVITVLLMCMVLGDWGRHLSLDERRRANEDDQRAEAAAQRATALFAVLIVFGYVTAGLAKRSWADLDPSTSGLLRWYYSNRELLGRDRLLAPFVPGTPGWLLELGDHLAVMLELSGLFFLLAGRVPWRVYLLLCTIFHFANALVLNINFSSQALTYLVFVDWTAYLHATVEGQTRRLAALGASVVAVAAGTWHVVNVVGGSASPVVFVPGDLDVMEASLYIGLPVFAAVIVVLVASIRSERRGIAPADRAEPVAAQTT